MIIVLVLFVRHFFGKFSLIRKCFAKVLAKHFLIELLQKTIDNPNVRNRN